MCAGIASPSIVPTQFSSLQLVRLQKKGIATPQGEGQLRGGGRSGQLISNSIWVGSPQTDPVGMSGPFFFERYDPMTGLRLSQVDVGFDVRSYSIDRLQRVYVFGGPTNNTTDSKDQGAIIDALTGNMIGGRFRHPWGFAKACAASMMSGHIFLSAQDKHKIFLVDMSTFEADNFPFNPPDDLLDASYLRWVGDITLSGCPAMFPRGIVQSGQNPDKIWVACKGANKRGIRPSYLLSFHVPIPLPQNPGNPGNFGKPSTCRRMPFGTRGVCINPDPSLDHDEIWVAVLGEQLGEGDIDTAGGGDGKVVVRVRDFGPGQPDEYTAITLLGNDRKPRGPFSIVASVFGDKYVACTMANEVWKLPKNLEMFLSEVPPSTPGGLRPPRRSLRENAVPGWPVTLSNRPIPGGMPGETIGINPGVISISIDGNGAIWVLLKLVAFIVRITECVSGSPVVSVFPTSGRGAPDTLGDFTGYYTAAGLFPRDDSDGDATENIDELTNDPPTNPFDFDNPTICP